MNALRGAVITNAGGNLFAELAATEKPLKISRVMFGTGKMPEGSQPTDMMGLTDLIAPFAEGACTTPIYENNTVSFVLEFRNDMNGGLTETVWLNEYGVFAKNSNDKEVMIFYGNLGDYADSVMAYSKGVIATRDYPIAASIAGVPEVELSFSASAFLTSQEADDLLDHCVKRTVRLESVDVRIYPADWSLGVEGSHFPYTARVAIERVSTDHYPDVTLDSESINDAFLCGLCPTVEAVDGALLFYAQTIPSKTLSGVCRLLSKGLYPSEVSPEPDGHQIRYRVINTRVRDPAKPDFGWSGEGAALEASKYTGGTEISVMLDGMLYDANNMTANAGNAIDGTLIVRK